MKWPLIALATVLCCPAWAAYKCKDESGKVAYQQHPCTVTGTVGNQINAAPAITTGSEDNGDGQARLEAIKDFNRKFDAVANQKIMRGMTKDQVTRSWGAPTSINRSVGSYGTHEQWVYRRGSHSQYIYLENGTVTSWQD